MTAIVETALGNVEGVYEKGSFVFRGIPYARAPVGELRWRPPVPPEPWQETLAARDFGPIAPQLPPSPITAVPGDPTEWSEDCLTLNIWTPGLDLSRRPVLVWIHGGGFVSGSGASILYEGAALAARGDLVVVTFNYRLGTLGFLAHPRLRDDVSGLAANWGLLDQLAALRWVRENIVGFGGDPGNVTVFGESAGAMSAGCLMASRESVGLFRRAILQSGPPLVVDMDVAAATTEALVRHLGLDEVDPVAMRKIPVAEIIAAQGRIEEASGGALGLSYSPVLDGDLIRQAPVKELSAGIAADIPLLIGTNRDEVKLFAVAEQSVKDMDDKAMVELMSLTIARIRERLKAGGTGGGPIQPGMEEGSVTGLSTRWQDLVPVVESIATAYKTMRGARGEGTEPFDIWSAISTDWVFRMPSLRVAEVQAAHQPLTFSYLFTWEAPAFGGALGACHALELPFVFGTLGSPFVGFFAGSGPEAEQLSEKMQDAWIAFARCGDPSHDGVGVWPPYDLSRRSTMVLGPQTVVVEAPFDDERRFWELDESLPQLAR